MEMLLIGALALLFVGALPIHPYTKAWGFYPGAIILAIWMAVLALVILR